MARIIDGIEYNVTEDNFLEKNGLRFIENENSSTIKIENKAMFESMERPWKYDKVILGDDLDSVKNPFEIINPDGTIVLPKVVNEMVVTKEAAVSRRMDIVLPTKITNVVITSLELSKCEPHTT